MRAIYIGGCLAAIVVVFSADFGRAADSLGWNGFYAGINAGAAVGTAEMALDPSGSFRGPTASDIADGNFWRGTKDLASAGFTGGLHAGYQIERGKFLLGLEAEADYLGLRDSSSVTAQVPASGNTYRLDQKVETDFFASLRPRLGYMPDTFSGHLMLFTTAGVTLTHARIDQKFTQINVAYYSEGLSEDRMLIGWTAGGGLEYALSKTWSVKAEYLYADLGSVERNNASGNAGFTSYTTDNQADLTAHIIRLGTAFHF